jgi:hypothetical protein
VHLEKRNQERPHQCRRNRHGVSGACILEVRAGCAETGEELSQ